MIDDPNLQAIARSKDTLKKTIVVGIIFIVLCAITSGVVVFCWKATTPPQPNLDVVSPKPQLVEVGAYRMLDAAIRYERNPYTERTIYINYTDRQRSLDHIRNVSSGLGWYAHSSTKESIVIAMPESELPALGAMEDDAERWIQDEIAANRPDRGPIGNADIVNVLVTVKTVGGRSDWVVLACGIASILVVFGLACVMNAIWEIITEWCRLRRLRHSLHTAGQEKA